MDKRMALTVAALAMASVSTCSMATNPGAFFINGNLGQSTYHDSGFSDNQDTSEAIRVGYSWQSNVVDFGVEAGYVDLGQAKGSVDTGNGSTGFTVKGKGPLLGVNIKYKFANRMFVSARGGWFRSKLVGGISGLGSESFQGDGSYAGAGVGYDLTPHFSLGVSYDDYHGRANVYGTKTGESVGVVSGFAEYRF